VLDGFGSDVGTKYIDTQYNNATAYYAGRIFGDTLVLVGEFGSAGLSMGEEVVGGALDLTGFGALLGIAVNVAAGIQLTVTVKAGFSAVGNLVGDTASLISRSGSDGGGGGSSEGTGNVPKNVYNSIKDAPQYPEGFQAVQNGTVKNTVNNKGLLAQLRNIEPGKWVKVYKDGYVNGQKVSIHYFQSQSGKVFDVGVKSGWSN
jgi:hypothetical protein